MIRPLAALAMMFLMPSAVAAYSIQLTEADYIIRCPTATIDLELDHGPIVVQRTVPVLEGDDEDRLSARILEQEHLAYPQALSALLVEPWVIEGRRVIFG